MTLPVPAASPVARTPSNDVPPPYVPPPQSAFVTVLAWLMIAGSVSGVLGSLSSLAAGSVLPLLMGDLPPDMQLPVSPLDVLRVVAVVSLLCSLYTLYASIALLNRKDWARRFFVAMFVLAIACNVLFLVLLALLTFGGAVASVEALGLAPGAGLMLGAMLNFFFGWTVMLTLLLWWWVHRLRSGTIRAEFPPPLAG